MNRDSEFEQQLCQSRPSGCDDLLPDTFYRAGWEAALQSLPRKAENSTKPTWRRTFVAGLACGLMVSLGLTAWERSSRDDGQQNNTTIVKQTPVEKTPSTTPDERPGQERSSVATVLEQGPQIVARNLTQHQGPEISTGNFLNAQQPSTNAPFVAALSPAARHHWSCVVSGNPESKSSASGNGEERSEQQTQLRSLPGTSQILKDLLL